MKTDYTDEQIIEKVKEVWADEYSSYKKPNVKVAQKPGEVHIRIWKMYEAPGLNLPRLMALADFFGSKNINDDYRFSHGGCETFDYGSAYGFELVVRPEKP